VVKGATAAGPRQVPRSAVREGHAGAASEQCIPAAVPPAQPTPPARPRATLRSASGAPVVPATARSVVQAGHVREGVAACPRTSKNSGYALAPVQFSRLARRGIMLGLSLPQLVVLAVAVLTIVAALYTGGGMGLAWTSPVWGTAAHCWR
jgi:hypothetical protein